MRLNSFGPGHSARRLVLAAGLMALVFFAPGALPAGEDTPPPTPAELPRTADAHRVYFPPTAAGWPGEERDERDIAPYLAFHQAEAMRRMEAAATVATTNQNAYDALFYDLNLTLDPAIPKLTGTVGVDVRVTAGPLSKIELDLLVNMVVDTTKSGGSVTTFVHNSDILSVNLNRAYATGETVHLTVKYHGNPNSPYFGFTTFNGYYLIWTLSEPFGARYWWPCKDYPEDKADSVNVRVTVPSGLITASNGKRVLSTDNGTTATTLWQERYPIATYLVSLTSYPYTTWNDWYCPTPSDSMPIQFFIFPTHVSGTAAVNAKVKNMIAAYAARFGEYPFLHEKYGHAEFLWGGGMEHQTCTSLGAFQEYMVAHELSHQWWGDMVTCRDFHHIWLNEGFATWSEAAWAEALGGMTAYHEEINYNRYFGSGTIYVDDLSNENRVFDSDLSYNKGSWVLHMLRHVMGDTDFFAALVQFRTQYLYSVATTENFRDVCEAVSGLDLDRYFQQWIYGEYYPAYKYSWTSAAAGGGYDVTVTLQQTQSWQLFKMPVDLMVSTASGDQTFVVQDSLASQDFVLHVTAAPTAVTLDKDEWILKTVEPPLGNPPLDRGVLLVNGVSWSDYGTEITSACNDKAFWGDYGIDFWDCFNTPAGGYPSTLPAPLGHGVVPPEVLRRYRNVIWLGNNGGGDMAAWFSTPIFAYLHAGGNVLLLTRMGDQFLTAPLKDYLGINWAAGTTVYDYLSTWTGLGDLYRLGTMSYCTVFDTTRTRSDSYLLYRAHYGYSVDRGVGVYRRPPGGGTNRLNGARFVFISGRPYRWNHTQIRGTVTTILRDFFLEPLVPADAGVTPPVRAALELRPPWPNPFSATTALRFSLPNAGTARLIVIDAAGRRVRGIDTGPLPAGEHEVVWNASDDAGRRVAAGIYWIRLESEGANVTRQVVLVR